MTNDTQHLLDAARCGDADAREALFRRHSGRLQAFIRASMSNWLALRVSPEDVLQESLLEAARKLPSFEPQEPGSFYRWLVAIAHHKITDSMRGAAALKRSLETPLDDAPAARSTSIPGRVARRERADLLHAALQRLPGRQAEALRLRYLGGLSTAETAERLGCTPSAVKGLVLRGMEELARRLLDPT